MRSTIDMVGHSRAAPRLRLIHRRRRRSSALDGDGRVPHGDGRLAAVADLM
ncbi:hypothetical protein [Streptomyces sp. Amel2xB2]|uniref:hypothetical protein n=1 Tax=Streptomyces sp. Amel2xB2 TaxID=1305829 RepID=UPI0015EBBB01|nr:hypothetical protein [Streptomyces sp. Amel2xB2]